MLRFQKKKKKKKVTHTQGNFREETCKAEGRTAIMAKKTKKGRSSHQQHGNKGQNRNGSNGKNNTNNTPSDGVNTENKNINGDATAQPTRPKKKMSKLELERFQEIQRRRKLKELAKKNSFVEENDDLDVQEFKKWMYIDYDYECFKLFTGKIQPNTPPVVKISLLTRYSGLDKKIENIPNKDNITYITPEQTHIINFETSGFVVKPNNEEGTSKESMQFFLAKEIMKNSFGKTITECLDMLYLVLKMFLFQNNTFSVKLLERLTTTVLTISEYNADMTLNNNQQSSQKELDPNKKKVALFQRQIRQNYCRLYNIDAKQPLLTWEQFEALLKTITQSPNLYNNDEFFLEKMSQWIIYNGIENESLRKDLLNDQDYNAFVDLFQMDAHYPSIIEFILGIFLRYCMIVKSEMKPLKNKIPGSSETDYTQTDLLITNVLKSLSGDIDHQSFQQHSTNLLARLNSFNQYLDTVLHLKYNFMNFLILNPTPNIFSQHYDHLRAEYGTNEDEVIGEDIDDLSIIKDNKQLKLLQKNETDIFQDLYEEEDVFVLHDIILNALFPQKTSINNPLTRKLVSILISLADPKTQPLPTDTTIVSIDYLSDIFLGSVWIFYMKDQCAGSGPQSETLYFKLSMLLITIIKATLPLLKLNSPDIKLDADCFESARQKINENWKANYTSWFPCDTDLRTLEILYMMNILATFAIFKLTLATGKMCDIHYKISPFSTFFIKLWCFQSFQIHQGILIDQYEEEKMTCETPNIVKAVIRGNTAWRCVNALLINTSDSAFSNSLGDQMDKYYTLVKHDYEHEPFNSFMSPHGRKLSTGALTIKEMKYEIITNLYTQETPFTTPEITQETVTNNKENTEDDENSADLAYAYMQNNFTELFPWPIFYADRYDGEARYMFDWEYDLYNEPEVSEPGKHLGNDAAHDGNIKSMTPADKNNQSPQQTSHPGAPRCYCLIDVFPDEDEELIEEDPVEKDPVEEEEKRQLEQTRATETKNPSTRFEDLLPEELEEVDYDIIKNTIPTGKDPDGHYWYDKDYFEHRFELSPVPSEPLAKVSATPESLLTTTPSLFHALKDPHHCEYFVWVVCELLKDQKMREVYNIQRFVLELLYEFHEHLTSRTRALELRKIRVYLKWFFLKNIDLVFHYFREPNTRNFAVILLNKLLEDPANYAILEKLILNYTSQDYYFLVFVLKSLVHDRHAMYTKVPNFDVSSVEVSVQLSMKQCFECLSNIVLTAVSTHINEHETGTENCVLIAKTMVEFFKILKSKPERIAHKVFSEYIQPYTSAPEHLQGNSGSSTKDGPSEAIEVQNFLASLFSFQYQLGECLPQSNRDLIFEYFNAIVSLLNNPQWDQLVEEDYFSKSELETEGTEELKNTTETLQHLALDKNCFLDFCKEFHIFAVDPKQKSLVHPYEHKSKIKPLATPLSCSLESYLALTTSQ